MAKAMELLARGRQLLVENNPGLAQGDIEAARLLLAGLRPSLNETQLAALDEIVQRLDLALANLAPIAGRTASPVLAAQDLELAWQMILAGLPGPSATPAPTLTRLTPTVTPTPGPSATPTP